MTTRMCPTLAIGVLIVLTAAPAAAQDEAFRAGLNARSSRDWTRAVAQFQEAVQADPEEASRRFGGFLGIRSNEYLPFFFLGEALFNLGDCAGAILAWEESERQGVVRRSDGHTRTLRAGLSSCETQGFLTTPALATLVQDAEAAMRVASTSADDLTQLRQTHGSLWTGQYTPDYDGAHEELRRARERFASGQQTRRRDDLEEAIGAAQRAEEVFRATHQAFGAVVATAVAFDQRARDVEELLQEARTVGARVTQLMSSPPVRLPNATATAQRQATDLLQEAEGSLAAARRSRADADLAQAHALAQKARRTLDETHTAVGTAIEAAIDRELQTLQRSTSEAIGATDARAAAAESVQDAGGREVTGEVTAELDAVRRELGEIRRALNRAVGSRDLKAARDAAGSLTAVNERLDAHLAALDISGTLELPDLLRQAAGAYFDGRYGDVLVGLPADAAASIDMPLRVQAHLLRSAALFALYQYSGRTDDALLAEARQEASVCRLLDAAACQPRPEAFSPAFLAFLASSAVAAR